jgi:formylglycine-generating enzyme required for sulfatase activity
MVAPADVDRPGVALRRSAPSRADLLELEARLGPAGLRAAARALGFVAPEASPVVEAPVPTVTAAPTPPAEITPSQIDWVPLPFWRVDQVDHHEQQEAERPVPQVPALRAAESIPPHLRRRPKGSPLVPAARLDAALARALPLSTLDGELDLPRLVERWSRAEVLEPLPRRARVQRGGPLTLVLDRAARLAYFEEDRLDLLGQCQSRAAKGEVTVLELEEGPRGGWRRGTQRLRRAPRFRAGERVLAFTDLGAGGAPAEAARWSELGASIRAAGGRGCALRLPAAGEGAAATQGSWRVLDLTAPGRSRRVSAPPVPLEVQAARAEALLTLLSPALDIDPAVVRALRRLLPAGEADLGTELAVWRHEAIAAHYAGRALPALAPLAARRQAFVQLPAPLQGAALEALARARQGGAWQLGHEELWTMALLGAAIPPSLAAELEAARQFFVRLARTLLEPASVEAEVLAAYRAWFREVGARLPEAAWKDEELGELLQRAWLAAREAAEEGAEPAWQPAGVALGWGPIQGSARRWQLWQGAEGLRLLPDEQSVDELPGGSVGTILAGRPEVVVLGEGELFGPRVPLGPTGAALPGRQGNTLRLRTDRQTLHLRQEPRPDWATAAGRDRYGLWAAFEVKGVEHRMRWIPPGRFWMGSPREEEGRWEDEGPRHEVELTRGFWLGEVPCTQDLWEAVMGSNPSEFQSPDRPVEQVNWEDCQRFLETVQKQAPALDLRLPTEAEWEYACRGGTTTSTYAGELEILGERNGPLLDAIAWYGGNSGVDFDLEQGWNTSDWLEKQYPHTKAGTRRVGTKRANSWGLYDTLGNVWEWCQDFFGDYSSDLQRDPGGPSSGSRRVIRGGSWFDFAQRVRAAVRLWGAPSFRRDDLGFRLARGQSAAPSQSGGGAPGLGVGAGAGSSRRNP